MTQEDPPEIERPEVDVAAITIEWLVSNRPDVVLDLVRLSVARRAAEEVRTRALSVLRLRLPAHLARFAIENDLDGGEAALLLRATPFETA